MGEIDAFHAAIFAAPADPLPRLAYADWLDDHGEADYAELIRMVAEVDRLPRPRAERAALRRRRFELERKLVADWRLGEWLGDRDWRALFAGGVAPDQLDLSAAELAGWERWPACLRPRTLEVRLGPGDAAGLAGCRYLERVTGLTVSAVGDGPRPAGPVLDALAASPHLGQVSRLELLWLVPSVADLRRFAVTPLVGRLTGLSLRHDTGEVEPDDDGHEWPVVWEVAADCPPAGAIAAALLAAATAGLPPG